MKKVFLLKDKTYKVLVVFDSDKDERIIRLLLSRSCAFMLTHALNLEEARMFLRENVYDIVIFGDFILGFANGGYGYLLVPDILHHQEISTISIMTYIDKTLPQKALSAGVDVVLSFYDIFCDKKLDENFELVPIVSLVDK
jgi:PleD family two-component response regulator